jgi:FixJ family two-component response regulator
MNSAPMRVISLEHSLKPTQGSTPEPVVFVVTSDADMRERLRAVLRDDFRLAVFSSAAQYLADRQSDRPACVVADLNLPDMTGLEFQRRIASTHRPVIFWARNADLWSAVRAIKAGAVDVLAPSSSDGDLLCAVRIAIDQDRAVRFTDDRLAGLRQRFSTITSRERQVLQLIVSGLLNKQVALELGIREVTVKVHRGKIMRKMAARSFADLVRMAGELGLAIIQRARSGAARPRCSAPPPQAHPNTPAD